MIKRRNNNKSHSIMIGSFLILFGIGFIFVDWYKDFKKEKNDVELVNIFFENNNLNPTKEEVKENKETLVDKSVENYIGILEIPKISFKRGLVDIDSKRNNVKYNIQIIKPSDMPNIENGNLILAGHSGTGYNAFFKDLDKLQIGDYSHIYYKNEKYTYHVVNIYEVEKNGTVLIKRNTEKTVLTMITCSETDKTKQIVIISELTSKEKY
ncbi:MAG: sortase [Firmicutes bacterium]|nr:sortase [Bacillota bacterium]